MIMLMRQMDRFQFMEIKLLADTSYITIFAESESSTVEKELVSHNIVHILVHI